MSYQIIRAGPQAEISNFYPGQLLSGMQFYDSPMDESKPRDKQEMNPDLDSNPQRILPTAADDGDPLFNIRGLVDHWIDRFQKVVIEDMSDIIFRSMIPTLDLMTRGIRPGELWVVAGHSKYCFHLWMVEQLCLNQQVPTLAYTYDMSVFEMVDRLVLSRSKYSRTRRFQFVSE